MVDDSFSFFLGSISALKNWRPWCRQRVAAIPPSGYLVRASKHHQNLVCPFMVNTRNVTRRRLRFETIDDLLGEPDTIEAADARGKIAATGNWTAGQIPAHLAAWIEYGYDGFPISAPPLPIRWLLRLMLSGMLRNGMRGGVHIPGVKGGTTGADDVPLQEGLLRCRSAQARLKIEPAKYPSPAFGPMSEEDRIRLHLRQAELHLGFIAVDRPAQS
jgi:hypothetical protein